MTRSIASKGMPGAPAPALRRLRTALALFIAVLIAACETTAPSSTASTPENTGSAEEFFVVDCLLPGQVRQLGGLTNYVTQRRPIKTSQSDCEIRGGEYVAYDRANYSTALKIWLPLAQAGDPAAQTYVGEIYEKGLGLTPDYALAAQWYNKAAAQKHSRAQINLGNLYEHGRGVPQDKQKALNLYRSASGLVNDDLLYVSTLNSTHVTKAKYDASQQQLAQSHQRGTQLQRELDQTRNHLDSQKDELESAQRALDSTRTDLERALGAPTPTVTIEETSPEARELASSVARMERYQQDLEAQITRLESQNQELANNRGELEAQLVTARSAQREQEQEITRLSSQVSDSRVNVSQSEQELSRISEQLLAQQEREQSLTPELIALQRELEEKTRQLNDEQVKLAQLEAEQKNLNDQLAASDARRVEYELRLKTMQEQMNAEQTGMADATRQIENLKSQLAVEKSLGLDSAQARETALEAALTAARQELAFRQKSLDEQRQLYAELEADTKSLQSRTEASQQRTADYKSRVDELQSQLQSAQRAQSEYEQQVANLSTQLERGQAQAAGLTPQLQSLQDELEQKSRTLTEQRIRLAELETADSARREALATTTADLERTSADLAAVELRENRETAKLRELLEARESQLDEVEHQLLLTRASLHMEQAQHEEAQAQLSEAHKAELVSRNQELEQLTEKLAQQYELVQSQEGDIARLQSEAAEYQAKLATAGSGDSDTGEIQVAALGGSEANPAVGSGPSIEIIEPPVVLTRSQASVQVHTFDGERLVVGKVTAPAGLLSLSVNGESPPLTANNLFRASIPLTDDPTPVEVVLIDNEGQRAAVTFQFVDHLEGTASSPIPAQENFDRVSDPSLPLGEYHALVIGNNQYRNFSTLTTAVNDARETERLLREKYGFKTRLLINADRYTMLSALNDMREKLDEDDNLLIYYAGHGKLDADGESGYWLPVDADKGNNINWISNKSITDILNVIEAKHILVVADSCYAGTLTQTPIARTQTDIPEDVRTEWIKVMTETRARITLTSGGVEPVLDGGGGKHSVFARAFLQALRDNDGVLEGYGLYSQVLQNMSSQASPLAQVQVPQYAPIHLAGHESGEFFFDPAG